MDKDLRRNGDKECDSKKKKRKKKRERERGGGTKDLDGNETTRQLKGEKKKNASPSLFPPADKGREGSLNESIKSACSTSSSKE